MKRCYNTLKVVGLPSKMDNSHMLSVIQQEMCYHPPCLSDSRERERKQECSLRCWICTTQAHWTEKCQTFLALNPEERINIAQENHACFSCLKRAGRDHRLTTCSRRKRCTETENGIHTVQTIPAPSLAQEE